MFLDYKAQVIAHYHKKKTENTISLRLTQPTPANLKEECLAVCHERFNRKDYQTLRTFFGQADDEATCLRAIGKCGIDKFRPLVNFLKEKTNDPDDKNIELLAWLIDFTPRPFELGKKYIYSENILAGNKEEKTEDGDSKNKGSIKTEPGINVAEKNVEIIELIKPKTNFKRKGLIVILVIITFTCISIFWPKEKKQHVFALTGHEACMFWAGDHYQQISCSQKMGDTLVIALDSIKLNQFKKITQPDTITLSAIGKVWYIKINKSIEYYTSDGNHPVHSELRLHPITAFIINKYIKGNGQPE